MMSTAEEVKAEMFGDNPPAGHHEVVMGPLFDRANRNGFSRRCSAAADAAKLSASKSMASKSMEVPQIYQELQMYL